MVLRKESKYKGGRPGRQGVESVESEGTEEEREKYWRKEKGRGECSKEEGL